MNQKFKPAVIKIVQLFKRNGWKEGIQTRGDRSMYRARMVKNNWVAIISKYTCFCQITKGMSTNKGKFNTEDFQDIKKFLLTIPHISDIIS